MPDSRSYRPPRLADGFLAWFCKEELLEEIRGDLHEYYEWDRNRHKKWWADLKYWYHILHFLRPFALKRNHSHSKLSLMPKIHIKNAFRRIVKHKLHSAINIFGLSLGLTAFLLILLFVKDEISYDRFHRDPDQVVRLGVSLNVGGQIYNEASIQFPAAEALRSEFPEIESVVRIYKEGDYPLLQYRDQKFIEDRLFFADADFFKIFGYPLKAGDVSTALYEPASILISHEMAQKYFGAENPLGKIIRYNAETPVTVKGVFESSAFNSHLKFDFLMPMSFQMAEWEKLYGLEGREKKWFWTGAWTYLRLKKNTDISSLKEKLPSFLDKYFPDRYKVGSEFIIQPIQSIHLESNLENEIESNGSTAYVIIFGAVALAVLFIACINFVNLNTIQALNRVKEIATRKAIGASKSHLISLIMGESYVVTILSCLLALLISSLLVDPFNSLTDKALSANSLFGNQNILILSGIVGIIGFLSGLYPALLVARYETVKILKGNIRFRRGSSWLRKILVTFQFVASISLIIGILIINQQLNFLQSKGVGYERDNLLVIGAKQSVNEQFIAFKEELLKDPHISEVTGASNFPGFNPGSYRFVPEGTSRNTPIGIPMVITGFDYTKAMGMKLINGRDFVEGSQLDMEEGFILNKRAVAELGWQGEAIGKRLEHFGPGVNTIAKSGAVIGVVEDFHFESLHHSVRPMVLTYGSQHNYYFIRLNSKNIAENIDQIDAIWNQFEHDWPMEYFLLEEELQKLYANERKLGQTMAYFAIMAICIAGIGIYALGSHLIMSRIKEIGIRKVLGARMGQVFSLVRKDFMSMIILANVIAWPLAFLFMKDWLSNFAFGVGINLIYFIVAGLFSLVLVSVASVYHVIKVNRVNVSKLLRDE